jgi:hypothetical protein
MAPVPHSDDLLIPNAPEPSSYEEERERTSDPNESFPDEDTEKGPSRNQEELDDLIRQLQLPKSKAEFLAFRLKEWRFLLPSCKYLNTELGMGNSHPFIVLLVAKSTRRQSAHTTPYDNTQSNKLTIDNRNNTTILCTSNQRRYFKYFKHFKSLL